MEDLLLAFEETWFKKNIMVLHKNPHQENRIQSQEPQELLRNPSQPIVRSFSDQFLSSKGSNSPVSVLHTTSKRLEKIISGKEFEEKVQSQQQGRENRGMKVKQRRDKRGGGISKSLSQLEFEELKGFTDLGFVFNEDDKDSNLGCIIPGLQRVGRKQGNDQKNNDCRVSRPYLSESWQVFDEKRKVEVNPVISWEIPMSLIGDEIEMKNHIRFWAHAVAAIVR